MADSLFKDFINSLELPEEESGELGTQEKAEAFLNEQVEAGLEQSSDNFAAIMQAAAKKVAQDSLKEAYDILHPAIFASIYRTVIQSLKEIQNDHPDFKPGHLQAMEELLSDLEEVEVREAEMLREIRSSLAKRLDQQLHEIDLRYGEDVKLIDRLEGILRGSVWFIEELAKYREGLNSKEVNDKLKEVISPVISMIFNIWIGNHSSSLDRVIEAYKAAIDGMDPVKLDIANYEYLDQFNREQSGERSYEYQERTQELIAEHQQVLNGFGEEVVKAFERVAQKHNLELMNPDTTEQIQALQKALDKDGNNAYLSDIGIMTTIYDAQPMLADGKNLNDEAFKDFANITMAELAKRLKEVSDDLLESDYRGLTEDELKTKLSEQFFKLRTKFENF